MGTETRSNLAIIDGSAIAATIYTELRSAVADLGERGLTPGLAVVLAGGRSGEFGLRPEQDAPLGRGRLTVIPSRITGEHKTNAICCR